ncbi:uncharacterized protein [Notamacropus eugenii]|uniref:uncharacterized protein n=1 Tax=Notamacropus eugenii TaxID=9315 RepID=UPI003B66F09B
MTIPYSQGQSGRACFVELIPPTMGGEWGAETVLAPRRETAKSLAIPGSPCPSPRALPRLFSHGWVRASPGPLGWEAAAGSASRGGRCIRAPPDRSIIHPPPPSRAWSPAQRSGLQPRGRGSGGAGGRRGLGGGLRPQSLANGEGPPCVSANGEAAAATATRARAWGAATRLQSPGRAGPGDWGRGSLLFCSRRSRSAAVAGARAPAVRLAGPGLREAQRGRGSAGGPGPGQPPARRGPGACGARTRSRRRTSRRPREGPRGGPGAAHPWSPGPGLGAAALGTQVPAPPRAPRADPCKVSWRGSACAPRGPPLGPPSPHARRLLRAWAKAGAGPDPEGGCGAPGQGENFSAVSGTSIEGQHFSAPWIPGFRLPQALLPVPPSFLPSPPGMGWGPGVELPMVACGG